MDRTVFVSKAFEVCLLSTAKIAFQTDMFSWRTILRRKCSRTFDICTRPTPDRSLASGLCGLVIHRPLNRSPIPGMTLRRSETYIRAPGSNPLNVTFLSFDVSMMTRNCPLDRVLLEMQGRTKEKQMLCGKKDPWFIVTENYLRITSILTADSNPIILKYSVILRAVKFMSLTSTFPPPEKAFQIGNHYYYTYEFRGRINSVLKIRIQISSEEAYNFTLFDGPAVSPVMKMFPDQVSNSGKTMDFKSRAHVAKVYVESPIEIQTFTGVGLQLIYEAVVVGADLEQCTNMSMANIGVIVNSRCRVPIVVKDGKYFKIDKISYQYEGPGSLSCDYAGFYIVLHSGPTRVHGPYCQEKVSFQDMVDEPSFVSDTSSGDLVAYNFHPEHSLHLSLNIQENQCRGVMITDCFENSRNLDGASGCYDILLDAANCPLTFTLNGHEFYSMDVSWKSPTAYKLTDSYMVQKCLYNIFLVSNVGPPFQFSAKEVNASLATKTLQIRLDRSSYCLDRAVFLFIHATPRVCTYYKWKWTSTLVIRNTSCGGILLMDLQFHNPQGVIYTSQSPTDHYYEITVVPTNQYTHRCTPVVTVTDKIKLEKDGGGFYYKSFKFAWTNLGQRMTWKTFTSNIKIGVKVFDCKGGYDRQKEIIYKAFPMKKDNSYVDNGCVVNIPRYENVSYFTGTRKRLSWDAAQDYCSKNIPPGYAVGSLANLKTRDLLQHLQVAAQKSCTSQLKGLYQFMPVFIGLSSKVGQSPDQGVFLFSSCSDIYF